MSSSPVFDSAFSQLNPSQKEAVETIEGPVMVVAGPGTGKTQVLTLRIANILLQTQADPSNVLALTFTESGALAMRKRLVAMIGSDGYKVELTTFHSFCNEVIKRNPEDFDNLISAESLIEVEQIQLIEEILSEMSLDLLKPFGDPLYHLKNILFAINDLKKEGVTPDDFAKGIEEWKKAFDKIDDLYHEKGAYKGQMKGKYQDEQKNIKKNEELLLIYRKYQEELRSRKRYDFNDMLLQVIEELQKNPSLLLRLQEQYQYILVDEHQDTNTAQNKLIELLARFYENPNLFVVGDEKQAIYRFQGASLENFLYFQKLYPTAKLIALSDNYRSTQNILDAAGSLIAKNLTSDVLQTQVKLKANAKYQEDRIRIAQLSDYHSEFYYIADDIQRKINQGILAKDIAILSRNNRDILAVAQVLEQMGVSYNVESDQNVFTDPHIRKLIMLFQAVCNFGSDKELILLMHADFLQIPYLDLYKLIRFAKVKRSSIYDVLNDKKKLKEVGLEKEKPFTQLVKNMEGWKKLCHNENLETVFVRLLSESGLLDFVMHKPNSLDILDKFAGIYEDIKMHTQKNPNFTLDDYLKYLDLLESHDILIKRAPQTVLKNAVRLMTTHRSKGLEFDWVYIINAFDGHWGNMKHRSSGIKIPWEYLGVKLNLNVEMEENDDERRLFYVALTRAKQGVVITYSTRSLEGKEQVMSQFVEEIEETFKEQIVVEEFENEFMSHKEKLFASAVVVKPDLKNVEFFRELFLERGLSATAVNNYLSCPWKFFYRNLLQLPEEKNKSLIFGSAVHHALNRYIASLRTGNPSQELLMNAFKESLARESQQGLEYKELLLKGEKVLPGFYDERVSKWTEALETELFIGGIHFSDTIRLTGKIDIIEPLHGKDVRVYDLKTGRARRRSEMEDYHRQLLFYKLLLDRYLSGKMNMVEGVIDFIEPDTNGKYRQEIYEMNPEEVKMLEDQIVFIGNEITTLAFWDRRCDDPQCEYCKLRDLMLTEKTPQVEHVVENLELFEALVN